MRPVTRGDAPRTYRNYGDAIGDLENRLGIYCSYCERRLPVSLAVEHVSPKSLDPALELDWSNFLLGCTNCNSVKGDTPTSHDGFLWPDRDNTLQAFKYSEGGFVELADGLSGATLLMAKALMDIVGLDRHKARGWPRPAGRDKRWEQREATWKLATTWKLRIADFSDNGRQHALPLIRDLAAGYGFFSVWMSVFSDDPAICAVLITAFPGTASDCFDSNAKPITRPAGRI